MEKIMGNTLPLTLELLYLWKLNMRLTSTRDRYMFRITSVASKKAITKQWLKMEVPKVEDWVKVVQWKS